MKLIYCAARAKQYAVIAQAAGFWYGAQIQDERTFVYTPPVFCDQNWHKPDLPAYVRGLARHRPKMATIMDWERPEQLPDVLLWAEEASRYVQESLIIIPKNDTRTKYLPKTFNGKKIVLGYSVPSKHGGAGMAYWEKEEQFAGWPVHLLGGSPHMQMRLYGDFNVVSADGDQHQLLSQRGKFWRNGAWHTLSSVGDTRTEGVPYAAFELSCTYIMQAWQRITDIELYTPPVVVAA